MLAPASDSSRLEWKPDAEFRQQFAVRTRDRVVFIDVRDIDWISGARNYVALHVGDRRHLMRIRLKTLTAQLDPRRFEQIHRSTVVQFDRVAEILIKSQSRYVAVLKSGARLPISRSYGQALRRRFWGTTERE